MNNHGYITLTSAIILSLVLMTVSLALSSYSFFSFSNIATNELKERSLALAESCAESALLKLKLDPTYGGNETLTINANQCSILPLETSGSQTIIKTKGTIQSITSSLEITVTMSDVTVVSWEQVNF